MSLGLVLRRAPLRRSFSTATQLDADVLIVGGGPAGLALASALARVPHLQESTNIALVEAGDLDKVRQWKMSPNEFSNRVSSLTNATQQFLEDIGAWSHVEEARTCPVEEMQVWDGISDARINFSASTLGLTLPMSGVSGTPQMSRLTENLNLQRGLLRFLDQHPAVRLLDKTKVSAISSEDGQWPVVQLDNGNTIRARLLVGADGPNSPVRKFAGIDCYGWAYPTKAIVATLQHRPILSFASNSLLPLNTTAFQRFLPTGPIAFLPLSDTVSSMVWSTSPELATAILASPSRVLPHMINAAFRLPELSVRYLHERILDAHKAGTPLTEEQVVEEITFRERSHAVDSNSAYSVLSPPFVGVPPQDVEMLPPIVTGIQTGTAASFPLRYNHTETYIGEGKGARTVLVGDAAHTMHPLAGQGLNAGMGDIECLARVISEAALRGADIGSYTALAPYARERYLANHTMMSAIDKLHKIYARQEGPIVWARSVGLEVINEMDGLKGALIAQAGGLTSNKKSSGWDIAASGVQAMNSTTQALEMVGKVGLGVAQRLLGQSK